PPPASPLFPYTTLFRSLRMTYHVESVLGDVVTLTETTSDRAGAVLRVDRASLRFLAPDALAAALTRAGFTIESRYGDFQRGPVRSEEHTSELQSRSDLV